MPGIPSTPRALEIGARPRIQPSETQAPGDRVLLQAVIAEHYFRSPVASPASLDSTMSLAVGPTITWSRSTDAASRSTLVPGRHPRTIRLP
jgi:hypothetical protein